MYERIIKSLQKRTTPQEEASLLVWRRSSRENEEVYQSIANLWLLAGAATPAPERTPPDIDLIIEQAEHPADGEDLPARGVPGSGTATQPGEGNHFTVSAGRYQKPVRWFTRLAVAASIALLLVQSNPQKPYERPDTQLLQIAQLSTGASETLLTRLSDGTTVFLAPNSTLRVSPTQGVREVWLEGRAFFGVARSEQTWPFYVRHAHGTVRVLGTRFEFSSVGEELRVVVVDGQVDVETADESVQLAGGQMSLSTGDNGPVVINVSDPRELLDWMGGALIFENTSLPQAAREIEREFGATIEVRGGDIAGQTISGGFKDQTFSDIVANICHVVAAECVIEGRHAVIASPDPARVGAVR